MFFFSSTILVLLLSLADLDASQAESFFVQRKSEPGDIFTIPSSTCSEDGQDKCKIFDAEQKNVNRSCLCVCTKDNATFGFDDNKWKCINNTELRTKEKCFIFPQSQSLTTPFTVVSGGSKIGLTLPSDSCKLSRYSYQDDKGSWMAGTPMSSVMNLTKSGGKYFTLMIMNDTSVLQGRMVKVIFRCAFNETSPACLLLKLQGNYSGLVASTTMSTTPTSLSTVGTLKSTISNRHTTPRSPSTYTIIGAVLGGVAFVAVLLGIIFITCRNKRKARRNSKENANNEDIGYGNVNLKELHQERSPQADENHTPASEDIPTLERKTDEYTVSNETTTPQQDEEEPEYDDPIIESETWPSVFRVLRHSKKMKPEYRADHKPHPPPPHINNADLTEDSNLEDEYEIMQTPMDQAPVGDELYVNTSFENVKPKPQAAERAMADSQNIPRAQRQGNQGSSDNKNDKGPLALPIESPGFTVSTENDVPSDDGEIPESTYVNTGFTNIPRRSPSPRKKTEKNVPANGESSKNLKPPPRRSLGGEEINTSDDHEGPPVPLRSTSLQQELRTTVIMPSPSSPRTNGSLGISHGSKFDIVSVGNGASSGIQHHDASHRSPLPSPRGKKR